MKYDLGGQPVTLPYLFVNATGSVGGALPWRHVYIEYLASAWGNGEFHHRQFYIEAALENGATSARITLDNLNVYTSGWTSAPK